MGTGPALLGVSGWPGASSLGQEDALLEVVVAQRGLLQALEGETQIEVEPGPHLAQLSLGQGPWKMPPSHLAALAHSSLLPVGSDLGTPVVGRTLQLLVHNGQALLEGGLCLQQGLP